MRWMRRTACAHLKTRPNKLNDAWGRWFCSTESQSFLCVCQVEEEGQLVLDRNPLEWSVDEVVQFINSTDCASLANIFQEQVHTHTLTLRDACVCTLSETSHFLSSDVCTAAQVWSQPPLHLTKWGLMRYLFSSWYQMSHTSDADFFSFCCGCWLSNESSSSVWCLPAQDIDGQALLLLTLPTVQECMDLKLGPAIKLCHQIERVKVAFYRQYAN